MPRYRARFVDREGRQGALTLDATDRGSLASHLSGNRGAYIIEVRALGRRGDGRGARIGRPMLLAALDSLELMLRSGVRINLALRTIADCAPDGGPRALWTGLVEGVEETGRFGESLRRFPRIFSPAVTGLIEAHEAAGRLPEGVGHARDYVAQMREIRRDSARGAAYPVLVLLAGLVSSAVLCFYTLPRFARMLRDIGVGHMNPVTAFFFWLSDRVTAHPGIAAMVLLSPFAFIWTALRPRFRPALDRLVLRLPLVRGASEALAMARIFATFRALSESGVRAVEALEACAAAAGNYVYAGGIIAVAAAVRDNATVGEGFERARVFAPEVVLAVKSAEGSLAPVLGRLAAYYSGEARHRVALAIGMIEPLMLVLVLVWVLGVALAVVLPIVEVLNGIR